MRLVLFSLTYLFTATGLVNAQNCHVSNNLPQHSSIAGLSLLWAQEVTGIDLAKKDLTGIEVSRTAKVFIAELVDVKPFQMNPCATADCQNIEVLRRYYSSIKFQWHGDSVAQLIFNPLVGSSSSQLVRSTRHSGMNMGMDQISNIQNIIADRPDIISASIGWDRWSDPALVTPEKLYGPLASRGIIIIESAANDFPYFVDQLPPLKVGNSTIKVGNIGPLGLLSQQSNFSSDVAILAPGAASISWGKNGFEEFSGTSAAQPMVAGVAANIIALLPGIKKEELSVLLEKSSIPSKYSNFRSGRHGILNAFKSIHVALRLKSEWPANRRSIFGSNALYDFSQQSKEYLFSARQKLRESSCLNQDAIDLLRRAVLLNPVDGEARASLVGAYYDLGLEMNAHFFESLSRKFNPMVFLNSRYEDIRESLARELRYDDAPTAIPALMVLLKDPNPYVAWVALNSLKEKQVLTLSLSNMSPIFRRLEGYERMKLIFYAQKNGVNPQEFVPEINSGLIPLEERTRLIKSLDWLQK